MNEDQFRWIVVVMLVLGVSALLPIGFILGDMVKILRSLEEIRSLADKFLKEK